MKAIVVDMEAGEVPQLRWEEVPNVKHGADEVLVQVKATAVNRADLMQAAGQYPPPAGESAILGLEMAGFIVAVGEAVTGWKVGDRVCALLPGGGYAEQVVVPEGMLMRLPEAFSFVQGTAVPEVWFTAYVNLSLEGNLEAGETILIHAGASGVGTAAIQLAKAIGAKSIATAGSAKKLQICRQLGAFAAINYKEQDFYEAVMEATNGKGVDVILDPVGGSYLDKNMRALRRYGRLVSIGLLGGAVGDLNMGLLLGKRAKIIGSTLRTRPLSEKIEITEQFVNRFWSPLTSGEMKPIIDRVFPIVEAQAAHQYVRENKNIGKVILEVG